VTESTIRLDMPNGVRIVVPNNLHLITPYVIAEQQDWFEDEIRFIRGALRHGDVVLDIGANYGVYTLSIAAQVGGTGAVTAVEPASRTAAYLRESVALNGFDHVDVLQVALSSRLGKLPLSLHPNSELNALIKPTESKSEEFEEVDVLTLDSIYDARSWTRLDFVKIDAEGEEINILRGGGRLLRELSPLIQFEIRTSSDFDFKIARELQALGYEIFRLVPGLMVLAPFDFEEVPDPFLLNLFAAKPDRVESLRKRQLLVTQSNSEMAFDAILQLLAPDGSAQYDWATRLGSKPYGAELRGTWESGQREKGNRQVTQALTLFAISEDLNLESQLRFDALKESHRLLQMLCVEHTDGLRKASYARVALAFGNRHKSVQRLGELMDKISREQKIDLTEPFLPPIPRFDDINPTNQYGNWIAASLVEAIELFSTYSSFYTNAENLRRLEFLNNLGFPAQAVQRRIRLIRARFPAQA